MLKRLLYTIIFSCTSCLFDIAHPAEIEKTEQISKTFQFKDINARNTVVVDNIWGSIHVTGYSGSEVQLNVLKTIHANSQALYERAQKEIVLEITEEDNLLDLYVDTPSRDNRHKGRRNREWQHRGFNVSYDFTLRVPEQTTVELKTVLDGDVYLAKTGGDYIVNNVNGGIKIEQVQGSGDVYAVNGNVIVDFSTNPRGDCRFGSLNGTVELYFLPDLSADFCLKTFNGEIYSDFPVTSLPIEAKKTIEGETRKVYKIERTTKVRVKDGGPEIALDGFNGDIFILNKDK